MLEEIGTRKHQNHREATGMFLHLTVDLPTSLVVER